MVDGAGSVSAVGTRLAVARIVSRTKYRWSKRIRRSAARTPASYAGHRASGGTSGEIPPQPAEGEDREDEEAHVERQLGDFLEPRYDIAGFRQEDDPEEPVGDREQEAGGEEQRRHEQVLVHLPTPIAGPCAPGHGQDRCGERDAHHDQVQQLQGLTDVVDVGLALSIEDGQIRGCRPAEDPLAPRDLLAEDEDGGRGGQGIQDPEHDPASRQQAVGDGGTDDGQADQDADLHRLDDPVFFDQGGVQRAIRDRQRHQCRDDERPDGEHPGRAKRDAPFGGFPFDIPADHLGQRGDASQICRVQITTSEHRFPPRSSGPAWRSVTGLRKVRLHDARAMAPPQGVSTRFCAELLRRGTDPGRVRSLSYTSPHRRARGT